MRHRLSHRRENLFCLSFTIKYLCTWWYSELRSIITYKYTFKLLWNKQKKRHQNKTWKTTLKQQTNTYKLKNSFLKVPICSLQESMNQNLEILNPALHEVYCSELYNTRINVRVPWVVLMLHICEVLALRFSTDTSYSVFFSWNSSVPSGIYWHSTSNCIITSSFHSISN